MFIHLFIHTEHLYSASSRELLRGAYTYNTYIHIHIQLYMRIHTYTRIYVHIHAYTYTYIHIHMYTYMNIHIYAHIYYTAIRLGV